LRALPYCGARLCIEAALGLFCLHWGRLANLRLLKGRLRLKGLQRAPFALRIDAPDALRFAPAHVCRARSGFGGLHALLPELKGGSFQRAPFFRALMRAMAIILARILFTRRMPLAKLPFCSWALAQGHSVPLPSLVAIGDRLADCLNWNGSCVGMA
jgi:hypothetical protein